MYPFPYQERHVHVHNPNAVIVGHNGKIIVGKHKRKKSIGSLHSEVKQQLMISTDIVSSSSSNQSEHGYNQKSNQRVARQLDLESSTSDSEKINSDDSEEDRSLRCNAMVKLKQCKTAAEIEKIVLDLKLELMKRTETKTKTLEKYFLGLLSTTDIPEQSNVKKLQHLDSLTKRENSSNMYTVI
ncbi:unnamed protein product [Mytilus coruscus]|uniref:Uncharacterized protein n=1 Tax=Mytilus coruscus TaxID=42192 RepID=A0A6J8CW38_MYTCO|nr:unnamed protein product [Mytilus coruscus]